MKQMQQISNIVNTPHRIVTLETTRCDTVVSLFDQYCRQSQIPVFFWAQGLGMTRLGFQPVADLEVQTADEVLKFISRAAYFGVFLLQDFSTKTNSHLSTELHRLVSGQQRTQALKLILLGSDVRLDESLYAHTLIVECYTEQAAPTAVARPLAVGKRVHSSALAR